MAVAAEHMEGRSWLSAAMNRLPITHRQGVLTLAECVLCESAVTVVLEDLRGVEDVCEQLRGGDGTFLGAASLTLECARAFAQGTASGALPLPLSPVSELLARSHIVRNAVSAADAAKSPSDKTYIGQIVHDLLLACAKTARAYYEAHHTSAGVGSSFFTSEGDPDAGSITKAAVARRCLRAFHKVWSGEQFAEYERASLLQEQFQRMYPGSVTDPHLTGCCFRGRSQSRPFGFYGETGMSAGSFEAFDEDLMEEAAVETASRVPSVAARARAAACSIPLAVASAVMLITTALLGACSKNYLEARKTWSPGAFTVCCSCSHPRILGFVVLDRAEGPLVLLNVLLAFFPVLPSYLLYDFGCGAFRCAAISLPWMVAKMRFASDLFHWGNHTCSFVFCPTAFGELSGQNSVAHEQRNRVIKELERTLRNQSRDNYITLLWYQAKSLNFRAMCSEEVDRLRREGTPISRDNFDEGAYYLKKFPCDCCAPALD